MLLSSFLPGLRSDVFCLQAVSPHFICLFLLGFVFERHCKSASLLFCFLSSGVSLVLETSENFFPGFCQSFPFHSKMTCSIEAKLRTIMSYVGRFSSVETASLFSEAAYRCLWEENT